MNVRRRKKRQQERAAQAQATGDENSKSEDAPGGRAVEGACAPVEYIAQESGAATRPSERSMPLISGLGTLSGGPRLARHTPSPVSGIHGQSHDANTPNEISSSPPTPSLPGSSILMQREKETLLTWRAETDMSSTSGLSSGPLASGLNSTVIDDVPTSELLRVLQTRAMFGGQRVDENPPMYEENSR
jgi:hypothetical protein